MTLLICIARNYIKPGTNLIDRLLLRKKLILAKFFATFIWDSNTNWSFFSINYAILRSILIFISIVGCGNIVNFSTLFRLNLLILSQISQYSWRSFFVIFFEITEKFMGSEFGIAQMLIHIIWRYFAWIFTSLAWRLVYLVRINFGYAQILFDSINILFWCQLLQLSFLNLIWLSYLWLFLGQIYTLLFVKGVTFHRLIRISFIERFFLIY